MKKGKAILLVGRRQWGKSKTLKELAGGSSYRKIITINGNRVFVRHSSNDDILPHDADSFAKFIESLNPETTPFVVIAFCPNFDSDAPGLLKVLEKKYELFFWVMEQNQNTKASPPGQKIESAIIDRMKRSGTVEVFRGKATSKEIASELQRFLENLLR